MDQEIAFDWDATNIRHIGRHGVRPNDVVEVFHNEATDLRYEVVDGEERWTSIGHTGQMRILVVVWTMRGESVRVVTAFEAGKAISSEYVKGKGW